jgi:hypothetical protein
LPGMITKVEGKEEMDSIVARIESESLFPRLP